MLTVYFHAITWLPHTHALCMTQDVVRYVKMLPGWGEGGADTSVGWQITLCDPIDKWRPVVLR